MNLGPHKMNRPKSTGAQHIHFIGIGGIGLSAIAKILLEEGNRVSGSDLQLSPLTANLEALGASVYQGHAAENVGPADLVIMSSAIRPDNPEVVAARQRGIPVIKRDQMLGRMMEGLRHRCGRHPRQDYHHGHDCLAPDPGGPGSGLYRGRRGGEPGD